MKLCLSTNMSSSEWAAWVQAFVSVVTIATGAATVWWQNRQAKKIIQSTYVERIRAVAMLLRLSAEAIEKWLNLWDSEVTPQPKVLQHHWRTFEISAEELRHIGVDTALSPVIVMNVILAKECLSHISEALLGLHLTVPSYEIGLSVLGNIKDLYHHEECIHYEARRLEMGLPATNTDDA